MDSELFRIEIERALKRAAETIGLAREIERALAGPAAGKGSGCLWRSGI
jgi:hypothetical protein